MHWQRFSLQPYNFYAKGVLMNLKSFIYFALVDEVRAPGVAKKIKNTVLAAKECGLASEKRIYKNQLSGMLRFLVDLWRSNSDVVMIRFSDLAFPLVFFVMVALRIRGTKIIVDVPTPRVVGLKEMDVSISKPIVRFFRKAITYFSASWVLLPASLIVQYADEGWWFSLGLRNKTYKIGNGILIDGSTPLSGGRWPADAVSLIGVAQLANWHGYDRLLKALAMAKKEDCTYKITLTIVGEGEELAALKRLASDLDLNDVIFTGRLSGKDLDSAFEGAHFGVSSLGLYRKGLNEASDLKTREYMARGLCVIGAGRDPDFETVSPYRFEVSNSDSVQDLARLLTGLKNLSLPPPEEVRRFAQEKLSLGAKLNGILEAICDRPS
ncbi:glycosyltransferase [Pseudomonas sp. LA21]|uniref:glycosyltransferase n=1 Tax=unclassified Pseudomonas TaxID=196821 RepID=UPI001FB79017|nr:glycosyltransferase [Pseudomonas sp. LA21]MCJ1883435.1 glycosyltransferase [Pseudomonas sp. LA21]